MPRFIAVHTMQFPEVDLKAAAKDMPPKLPPGVTWKLTIAISLTVSSSANGKHLIRRRLSKSSRRATCLSMQSTLYDYSMWLRQSLSRDKYCNNHILVHLSI